MPIIMIDHHHHFLPVKYVLQTKEANAFTSRSRCQRAKYVDTSIKPNNQDKELKRFEHKRTYNYSMDL